MDQKRPQSIEIYQMAIDLQKIGRRAVRAAQEENRRLGIPNSYVINGKRYFELPNGDLTQKNPNEEEKG